MKELARIAALTEEELRIKAKCMGSLLFFIRYFYELRTGRTFQLSHPKSNETHFITVCRELTDCFRGKTTRLMINLPPGWGKSEICKHFIAWCMTYYPDCNFLYVSHSVELAAKHTHGTKQIMEHPMYKKLFGVEIRQDSSAKDNFTTTKGGCVSGWGAKGGITGFDAGLPGQDRFSGCLLIDDIHKPDEVHSDTIREHVKRNYTETLERRLRSPRVPVIFIGQRLHEDDLPANLLGDEKSEFKGMDGQQWKRVIIKAIDACGNAVYPELNPLEMMKNLEERSPYVYSSQYQQEPQPAGGSIFKPEWFTQTDIEPEILGTFIIIDSAETDKTYNDATVLSHFGVYRIEKALTETFGLHWLACREIWIEPKDLESELMDFFAECSRHEKSPQLIGIEKKSTGTTLLSVLKEYKGCRIVPIERHSASGSKTTRMLGVQPIVASRRVSLPKDGSHTQMCIEHMRKITANNTHARDDIADTLVDGIQLGLIDRIIQATMGETQVNNQHVAKRIMGNLNKALNIKKRMSWR